VGGGRAVFQRKIEGPKKVNPLVPAEREPSGAHSDPLDRSGESVIALLEKAARSADDDCRRAMDLAHKLSMQLRAAEDRANQLQAQVEYFQDRAVRAENWMARVYKEIEERFMSQRASKSS
jgi:hypothetical protein